MDRETLPEHIALYGDSLCSHFLIANLASRRVPMPHKGPGWTDVIIHVWVRVTGGRDSKELLEEDEKVRVYAAQH